MKGRVGILFDYGFSSIEFIPSLTVGVEEIAGRKRNDEVRAYWPFCKILQKFKKEGQIIFGGSPGGT
jgi:hypothetical protein